VLRRVFKKQRVNDKRRVEMEQTAAKGQKAADYLNLVVTKT
jgi:hypothetical protein